MSGEPLSSSPASGPTPAEVRERAASGAVLIAVRGTAIRVIGFLATLVLARLLAPRDIGIVQIGLTVTMFAITLSDGGLGASLIRGKSMAQRRDLESLLGFQLGVTTAITAACVASGLLVGGNWTIAAVMLVGLPVTAFRSPTFIQLERDLNYRPIALIELSDVIVYNAWAVSTVLLGWGVWGLATASIASALGGSLLAVAVAPTRVLRPRLDWQRVRPHLRFGAQFQANGLVNLGRDQGLNIGTAAIAGIGVLGVWSIAYRILRVPFLLFESLWRVSFPAMARLLGAGEDPRPVMERALGLTAVATAVILVGIVGSAPALIPATLGPRWAEATSVLPVACGALMIGGPVAVAVGGYLLASGDSATPLKSTVIHTVVQLTVGLGLLPWLGVTALGIGWLASAICDALILGSTARRRTGLRYASNVALPTVCALVGAAVGCVVADRLGETLTAAVGGLLVAEAVLIGLLLICERRLVLDLVGIASRGTRKALSRAGGIQTPSLDPTVEGLARAER